MKNATLVLCLLAFGAVGLTTRIVAHSTIQDSDSSTVVFSAVATELPRGPVAQDSQTFTGRVTQAEGKFVLEDVESKATFLLDDQDKAKEFNGKNVKVTGTLDPNNNTIHVVDIQEA